MEASSSLKDHHSLQFRNNQLRDTIKKKSFIPFKVTASILPTSAAIAAHRDALPYSVKIMTVAFVKTEKKYSV